MDVNVTADVKGYGLPVVPSVEVEDRSRPQVQPVQDSNESVGKFLDEKALHGREAAAETEHKMSRQEAQRLVEQIRKRLDPFATQLNIILDEETGTLVAKITDRETGELIRQFPSEALLHLRASLAELVGVLYDKMV